MVELLIRAGCNMDFKDDLQRNGAAMARMKGHAAVTNIILQMEAEIRDKKRRAEWDAQLRDQAIAQATPAVTVEGDGPEDGPDT